MMTALVVDADRETREVWCWLLTSWGYRVETAGDGLECLNQLHQFVPDVLILGSQLPWGDSDGVLAVLHDDPRLLPARVVVTSSGAPLSELHDLALAPALRALEGSFGLSIPVRTSSPASPIVFPSGRKRSVFGSV